MFGFSLAAQLFQGSAQRTWNCVTQFTNQIWYKFNHYRHPEMPRSRRRHHSRSRSRSRSHSHDRDRDVKRRKIDNVDSPAHKRSVSAEPQSPEPAENIKDVQEDIKEEEPEMSSIDLDTSQSRTDSDSKETEPEAGQSVEKPIRQIEDKLTLTPKRTLSPKQVQKKLESEKKRQQRQQERDEREKKRLEEKERLRVEKEQAKKEKEDLKNKKNEQKAKERELKEEQKRKEREEKEAKRKEKEEREEAKRKEREQEKLKKQQEQEEKNREKQKIEEQKQKAAQAFANFFVAKKTETKPEEPKSKLFMPFQVKSDMRLPLVRRDPLTEEEKSNLVESLNNGDLAYLKELKTKKIGTCPRTWPYEEDVILIEEDIGESICEDKQKLKKMRVKFLRFHENRRPPYYGTWRKKSKVIKSRKPIVEDTAHFDYEVDSDDDWEEEEQGESLNGSDDEEKDNEVDNEDYEVDNEFFVPHGHLSDDEVDDEASSKLSPESHKEKLKLLKDEFDQDMKTKTNKMKPRSIGCVWYSKDRSNVDDAIDRHLRPLAIITNGRIFIAKRKDPIASTPSRRQTKELRPELIPSFLKVIQGNVNRKAVVVEEFMQFLRSNDHVVDVSKSYLGKCVKQYAQWRKCADEGPMLNKYCWCLEEEVKKKYNFE